jgi:transcriptional regulator GlxA family with amidase domain
MDLIRNRKSSAEAQKRQFDELCVWIDAHIGEPMGWQQLMEQSGLDFQSLQALFFQYKSTTAMTWIRHRREIARLKLD